MPLPGGVTPDRFHLDRFFDCIVVEGEFGCGKPDERVFRHALSTVACDACDAWMIGDNLECQVAHTGDASYEFFPSTNATGNCGTFLSVDNPAGPQLYGGSSAASNSFTTPPLPLEHATDSGGRP